MQICQACGHAFPDEQGFCEKCYPNRCHKCGFENDTGAKYCVKCGHKLHKLNACACGAENEEDAVFCYACGRPLTPHASETKVPQIPFWPVLAVFLGAFALLTIVCFFI